MRGKTIAGLATTAAVLVGSSAWQAIGAVSFEFRDVAGDVFGGPNETEVARGGSFAFNVWLHATGGEQVAGVSFKLRFNQYASTAPWTFNLTGVNHAVGAFDTPTTTVFSFPEPLTPSNSSDLGAFSDPSQGGWVTGSQLVARLTLAVTGSLPKGIYTISPDPGYLSWFVPETGDEFVFNAVTPYTVHVIPEPVEYAVAAGLGLLGFGLYRRFRNGGV